MNMTQLVLGCALGFIIAQGMLYGLRRLFTRKARVAAADADGKSMSFVRGFIRYAAPAFASAAFVLLGAWTLQDYLSAKAAPVVADVPDPATAPVAPQTAAPETVAAAPGVDPDADSGPDPYADPDFKVTHHARAGNPQGQARAARRTEGAHGAAHGIHQHAQRSQYDCEAADHATATSRRAWTCGASPPGRRSTSPWRSTRVPALPSASRSRARSILRA